MADAKVRQSKIPVKSSLNEGCLLSKLTVRYKPRQPIDGNPRVVITDSRMLMVARPGSPHLPLHLATVRVADQGGSEEAQGETRLRLTADANKFYACWLDELEVEAESPFRSVYLAKTTCPPR